MSIFVLSLLIAAIVCGGVLWRRPDARAVASGAWQSGKAQAVREFRDGYTYAQKRLRAGSPRWYNPRRWLSWGLATGYGAAQTIAAGNRIRKAAWDGARERYAAWKASQPVDGEVVEENTVAKPAPEAAPDSNPDPRPEADPTETARPATHDPGTNPEPESDQEGTTVQTEATGLTSYAAAHQQFASELRAQMSGSEALAASMSNILAEHSDLIGDTAVLMDLLNQAAGIADRIAERATAVANN